ncbi:LCP family protein [Streptomyces sp. NPDC006638]|uniref:LCP family protein n=1 Tax=Streptomyces sp. NPDC006638 TaxID=3157183 RepID=UPI0033BA0D88
MGHSSTHRERSRRPSPHARELGWDDSLYDAESDDGAGTDGGDTSDGGTGGGGGAREARTARTEQGPADGAGSGDTPDRKAGRAGRRPGRRRWRIVRWIAGVLALLILGAAGAGYLYYRHLNGNIRTDDRTNGDTGLKKPAANEAGQTPLNILLIGSDSRADPENVKLGGSKDTAGNPPLADVQMLFHVSADRKNASVVSIPRDTRVDIPECKDSTTGKVYPKTNGIINETLGRGGPGCTLSTWENLTGVYIDHWMTIDFSGVVKMADAIGGVDVCVKDNVWDRPLPGVPGGSGLKLEAGTTRIKGEQALQWLRTRHAFSSDIGRARAQHMYMNSMIRELKSQNVFTDSVRLTGLAEAATKSLEVSEEIGTVKKLFDLGMQLKAVPTNRLTMTTMPWIEDPQNRNHVVPNKADADRMWTMIRDDVAFDANGDKAEAAKKPSGPASKEPSDAPADTGVTVLNGTGGEQAPVSGRARAIAEVLGGKGYSLARAGGEQSPQEATGITYPSADLEGDAQAVAKALKIPLTSVTKSTQVSGITLVVGADWREGSSYPAKAKPEAGGIPDTADAISGSDKNACMDVYAPYRF